MNPKQPQTPEELALRNIKEVADEVAEACKMVGAGGQIPTERVQAWAESISRVSGAALSEAA